MRMEIKTLGILGGGQLGRMSALAAARLGIRTHIYCPEENCPASQITDRFTHANYEDHNALRKFADSVDVITYEFENIPLETIDFLSKIKPVRPDRQVLEISQNRLKEKAFLNKIGIFTARWQAAYSAEDIDRFLKEQKLLKCIVKTTRFGYDGKGQIKQDDKSNSFNTWASLKTEEAVCEEIVDFAYEASMIVARDVFGKIALYPLAKNDHANHILCKTSAPFVPDVDDKTKAGVAEAAAKMAHDMAVGFDLVGLIALELFVMADGTIYANEIAPRTHNSGHWTMDGCNVSQFEQHVRAVCGLPVLEPKAHSEVTMINLIGDDVKNLPAYYEMNNACVHLYGKMEAREGRKMGHVNLLKPLEN